MASAKQLGFFILCVDVDGIILKNNTSEFITSPDQIAAIFSIWNFNQIKVIINTCRTGESLKQFVELAKKHNIKYDAINDQHPYVLEHYPDEIPPRKIFCHKQIDDTNIEFTKERATPEDWSMWLDQVLQLAKKALSKPH